MINDTAQSPHVLRGIGPALIVLAGLFQWLEWWQHQSPFIPLVIPNSSMFVYMGICVLGLLVLAQPSGRHPKWGAFGLIPLIGPLVGIAALVRPSMRAQAQPPSSAWSKIVNVLLFALLGLLGLAFLGFLIMFQNIQVSKASPDRSARVVVHGRVDSAVYVQESWGMFLTSSRRVLWAGDFARVKRVIWSKDGSRFLLIGADSDTSGSQKVKLPNARGWFDALFVMYDRPSGKLWFNSTYRKEHPPFTLDDVRAIDWAEPVLGKDTAQKPKFGHHHG